MKNSRNFVIKLKDITEDQIGKIINFSTIANELGLDVDDELMLSTWKDDLNFHCECTGNFDISKFLNIIGIPSNSIAWEIPGKSSLNNLKNVQLESGRICGDDFEHSVLISNKYPEELIANVELGVRDMARKLIENGYDLVSSCQGHPEDECESTMRTIKVMTEHSDSHRLLYNIQRINVEFDVNIKANIYTDIKTEDGYEEHMAPLGSKSYEDPVHVYITYGRYDDCETNYNTMLDNFDKYNWQVNK